MNIMVVRLALLFTAALALSSCATKRVMKDCEQVNGSHLYFCKMQFEVWR